MKNTSIRFLFLFTLIACHTQTTLSFDTRSVDLSTYPIFPHLVDEKGDSVTWKSTYKYLDEIEIQAISYLSDGLKINGVLVKPRQKGKYPCVIYNRGGNPNLGEIRMADAATRLGKIAKEGYVVMASQYRNGGGSEGKDEFGGKDINDVLKLIDLLGEVEYADTSRIAMYGWSRGGMMTFLALTKTNKIDAVIVGGALSDCFTLIEDRPQMEAVFERLIPNYETNKETALKSRSVIHWVDQLPKKVPILMLHGQSDRRVKVQQAEDLAAEMEKNNIPHQLILYKDGSHGLKEYQQEVDKEVLKWLSTYL